MVSPAQPGILESVPPVARHVSFSHGAGPGLDGSSDLAVQQWVHGFDAFDLRQLGL